MQQCWPPATVLFVDCVRSPLLFSGALSSCDSAGGMAFHLPDLIAVACIGRQGSRRTAAVWRQLAVLLLTHNTCIACICTGHAAASAQHGMCAVVAKGCGACPVLAWRALEFSPNQGLCLLHAVQAAVHFAGGTTLHASLQEEHLSAKLRLRLRLSLVIVDAGLSSCLKCSLHDVGNASALVRASAFCNGLMQAVNSQTLSVSLLAAVSCVDRA